MVQLLTACELEFGIAMPHGALNDVNSVEDVVSYWEARLSQIAENEAAAARHFTVAHPSNVFVAGKGKGAELQEWLREHTAPGEETLEVLDDDDDDDDLDYFEEEEEPEPRGRP